MTTYKLYKSLDGEICNVLRDGKDSIPFDPDNTDYQQFKKDLADGASLKDAEGNDMTAEQIITFLGTLS
jgi:hypothetical protein